MQMTNSKLLHMHLRNLLATSTRHAGTHLILPPCVSLGRQNINRFSSPKNLRLMNSIRESCRSIEELDLGGNKLNDLIEVYKILQCTPNLRFLNLSENDLSRSAPVAMASNSLTLAQLPSTVSATNQCSTPNWHSTGQRSCLAPLNQNTGGGHHSLGARRHSTLGPSSSSSARTALAGGPSAGDAHNQTGSLLRARQIAASRVAEARRLAAANALAQSKKTSSSVASKLANSASGNVQDSGRIRDRAKKPGAVASGGQRHQAGQSSTMHLARSLSSLSAKDIRASSSSISRLASHRRTDTRSESSKITSGSSLRRRPEALSSRVAPPKSGASLRNESDIVAQDKANVSSSSSHQKLYVEPIAETEDVDMGSEQQLSPNSSSNHAATPPSNANERQIFSGSNNDFNNQSQLQPQSTKQNTQQQIAGNSGNCSTPKTAYNHHGHPVFLTNTTTATSSASITSSQMNSFRRTFSSIKALALNNTGCQWRVVCSILSRMPNVEELHLSLNNYEKIDLEPNEFKHHSLKRLYLCNNPKLTNWEELDKLLIAFPSLEALSIANCNISQIPDNLDRAREWRKLCGLNINGWPIKEWPVVERLNQLPSLVDLKCRNLEVLNTIDEPRHHLIARLPKLQRLNGSEIEEREDAEKAFIRFFMANSHLERPSRFHELMQIYGEISTVDVDVDLSPPSQAQVRVIYLDRSYYRKENNDDILMSEDFLLKLMDNADSGGGTSVVQQNSDSLREDHNSIEMDTQQVLPSSKESPNALVNRGDGKPVRLFKDEGQEIVELNVDLRQSVRKFKSNLASLFGLHGQNLILYYIDHEMVGLMGPELLKHNQKKLWNYNVQDGDQFIVEER